MKKLRLPKKGKYPALERAGFLVPIKISEGKSDKLQRRGSEAFVAVGTELPKGLKPYRKIVHLRELAYNSPFFIKNYGRRQQMIEARLEAAGIKIEKPVQILNNGRAVFKKTGHSLDSEEGKRLFLKDFWGNAVALEEMVGKMHGLGITHNHLHGGNITIDEKGVIRFIDFGKATMADIAKLKRAPKGWAIRKFFKDLGNVAGTLTVINAGEVGFAFRNEAFGNMADHYPKELVNKIPPEDYLTLVKGYAKAKERFMELKPKKPN